MIAASAVKGDGSNSSGFAGAVTCSGPSPAVPLPPVMTPAEDLTSRALLHKIL